MAPEIFHSTVLELQADTQREFGEFTWRDLAIGMIARRPFRAVISMRLCQAANRRTGLIRLLLFPVARFLHRVCCHRAGIDLPWNTAIAPGLALTHGWGIVISPGTRIGSNVTIFHGATLGRLDRIASDGTRETAFPVIEDDVWIGPHAIIVGGVRIGRGSRIAGGAYIYRSIPPYSIVAGNPSSIIRSGCIPDVPNKFDLPDQ